LKARHGMSIAAIMRRAKDLELITSALRTVLHYLRKKAGIKKGAWSVCRTESSSRFEQFVVARRIRGIGQRIPKGAALLNESLLTSGSVCGGVA